MAGISAQTQELKYHSLAWSRYFLNGQREKPSHEFTHGMFPKFLKINLIWSIVSAVFPGKILLSVTK